MIIEDFILQIITLVLAVVGLLALIFRGISLVQKLLRRDKDFEAVTDRVIKEYRDLTETHASIRDRLKEAFEEKEKILLDEIEKSKRELESTEGSAEYYAKLTFLYQTLLKEAAELTPELCANQIEQTNVHFRAIISEVVENLDLTEEELDKACDRRIKVSDLSFPASTVRHAADCMLVQGSMLGAMTSLVDILLHITELYNKSPNDDVDKLLEQASKATQRDPIVFPFGEIDTIFEKFDTEESELEPKPGS